jgi:hypothetical protein
VPCVQLSPRPLAYALSPVTLCAKLHKKIPACFKYRLTVGPAATAPGSDRRSLVIWTNTSQRDPKSAMVCGP